MIARFLSRRAARNALIALATIVAVAAMYSLVPSPNAARRLTLATAYAGLALLAATLWIGPWYVLRRRRPPVSLGWRRDLGIWAALVATLHTVVGLRVHFRGDWRRYFFFPPRDGGGPRLRSDGMGWANHAGLLALLVMLVLLAISNDLALRRLGPARWKVIQRWNYAGFALVALHGVVYQILVRRAPPVILVLLAVVVLTAAVQITGLRMRRAAGDPGGQ